MKDRELMCDLKVDVRGMAFISWHAGISSVREGYPYIGLHLNWAGTSFPVKQKTRAAYKILN